MPKKIVPSKKAKARWAIHLVLYAIGVFLMWFLTYHGKSGWIYPWPIWITAAWGLALTGHTCVVFSSHEDKGHTIFREQVAN